MQTDHFHIPPDRMLACGWGELSYSDKGTGTPVLMLHGHGRCRLDFEPYAEALPQRRCLLPDFRGHGGSDVPTDFFGIDELVADMFHLVDELWLGRFDLVGHSLGGMVALMMLKQRPDRIGKVALLEGWTSLRYVGTLGDDVYEGLPEQTLWNVKRMTRDFLVRWAAGVREDFWLSVVRVDMGNLLRRTTHEVLEVYGDRGRARPDPRHLGIPENPHVGVEWIAGGTHFFPLVQVDETSRLLQRFLLGGEERKEKKPDLPPATLDDLALGFE